jgi:hypothetical protein
VIAKSSLPGDLMAYFEHLWLYFILLVGIIIVPGMDMMFVLANALVGGDEWGSPRPPASWPAVRRIR